MNTTLECPADAAGLVQRYIGLHRELRLTRAYHDPARVRQMEAAGMVALHAILAANRQTGFSAMIEACSATDRARLERPA